MFYIKEFDLAARQSIINLNYLIDVQITIDSMNMNCNISRAHKPVFATESYYSAFLSVYLTNNACVA